MKHIVVSTEGRNGERPSLIFIPLNKINEVRTFRGSENTYGEVNGIKVIESYSDILEQIDYWGES